MYSPGRYNLPDWEPVPPDAEQEDTHQRAEWSFFTILVGVMVYVMLVSQTALWFQALTVFFILLAVRHWKMPRERSQ